MFIKKKKQYAQVRNRRYVHYWVGLKVVVGKTIIRLSSFITFSG
jgi:hypothetical protein